MPRPRWYLQGGVCATAVTSLVGLVHPNIHIVWRKKVPGSGPPVPLDGSIYGFQVLTRGKVPVLKYQELLLGKEIAGWP